MNYLRNEDLLCQPKGCGLSYNQVLDISDVEESSGDFEMIVEPVTLEEVKNFCKIDVSDDDSLLDDIIIPAARRMCEEFTNIGFVQREIAVVLNNGNGGSFLPLGPVGNISLFSDKDGNEILSSNYRISGNHWKQIIEPRSERMTVTYTAGYETLPENLKTGLLNTIMYLYDNRSQGTDNIGPIAKMILSPLRRVW